MYVAMWTQDRVDYVVEARLYLRDVTSTCFRRRYTLFAENRVAIVTKDVDLYHSMTPLSSDFDSSSSSSSTVVSASAISMLFDYVFMITFMITCATLFYILMS